MIILAPLERVRLYREERSIARGEHVVTNESVPGRSVTVGRPQTWALASTGEGGVEQPRLEKHERKGLSSHAWNGELADAAWPMCRRIGRIRSGPAPPDSRTHWVGGF